MKILILGGGDFADSLRAALLLPRKSKVTILGQADCYALFDIDVLTAILGTPEDSRGQL